MHTEKCSMNTLMQLVVQILQTAQYYYCAMLFKTTASITVWLETQWGTSTPGARQAWARWVPSIRGTVHSPLVLSTQPSSQHTPTAGASLPSLGREPKCSWELGQVCVIGNKKIPTNNIVLGLSMRCP